MAARKYSKNEANRGASATSYGNHAGGIRDSSSLGDYGGSIKNPSLPTKKFFATEMKERREKGLCYNCDEKYTRGHRCKVQRIYLLDASKDEEGEPETEREKDDSDVKKGISRLLGFNRKFLFMPCQEP